ncbi:ubiquitin-conjugating enzyme [Favolaschia claudopus]|uniref:Ubiquitin-conjugating enzyme n=1 Tax=Favolaschia claudopus TaxID=2862362 RepID=A0AAW0CIF2_9AGAR
MSSRLCRQSLSTTARAARSVRSNVHPPRRLMSADAAAGHHAEYKPKSDMPWIIGAAAISGPLLAYLLRDTFEIKKKIAAGHHGHDSHDAHAASADHSEAHEEHVAKAEAKEKSDLTDAASSNALPSKQEESTTTDEAAAEPPKDANKQDKAEKEKAEKDDKEESK